jgi:hypothetical protein
MKSFAMDDYAEIRKHLARIKDEEVLRCPRSSGKLLVNCLKETAPCPAECRYHADWTGPDKAPIVDDCCG